jgi:hypothetical protein
VFDGVLIYIDIFKTNMMSHTHTHTKFAYGTIYSDTHEGGEGEGELVTVNHEI